MTTYEERGVSAEKTDVKRAISGLSSNLFPGAFCWVVGDVFTGNPGKVLISHADGAGTKASLAYVQYKETGDPAVFRGIAQDSLAMNVDDMATIGCFGPYLFSNTIGRNAMLVDGEVIRAVIDGYQDRIALLAGHGIHLEICGGETADMGDVVRTIVVDSTLSAMMNRADVIDASNIAADQAIVGHRLVWTGDLRDAAEQRRRLERIHRAPPRPAASRAIATSIPRRSPPRSATRPMRADIS